MSIFKKKIAGFLESILLLNLILKFFDMSKNTAKHPVLKRNGVKNSVALKIKHLQILA
jgi:hypothetical protein